MEYTSVLDDNHSCQLHVMQTTQKRRKDRTYLLKYSLALSIPRLPADGLSVSLVVRGEEKYKLQYTYGHYIRGTIHR